MATIRGKAQIWIADFVRTDPGDECVTWPYARNVVSGYAVAYSIRKGGSDYAYRVIWERVHDQPFPGQEARHTCGKGADGCVNWKHIIPGTTHENAADRAEHEIALYGHRVRGSNLNDGNIVEICRRIADGESIADLATAFDISYENAGKIWRGEAWQHVDVPRLRDFDRRCEVCNAQLPRSARNSRMFCGNACKQKARYRRTRAARPASMMDA